MYQKFANTYSIWNSNLKDKAKLIQVSICLYFDTCFFCMYYSVAITKKCNCERQKQILAGINLALNDEAQYFSRIFTKLQLAQAHISFFSQENYHQHQWIWNIDQWRPWRQRAFQRMIFSYNFFEQRQKILLRQLHRPKNIFRILYLHYMYLLVSTTV